jgi:hypothetical protein
MFRLPQSRQRKNRPDNRCGNRGIGDVPAGDRRVSGQMPREMRCTAFGGLSITKTSLAIEEKLAAKQAAACGAPGRGCAS